MPPKETTLTKDELEVLWQGASRFAKQCSDDYRDACKEYGNTSSVARSAWKRFDQADRERKEAQKRWETAN